MALGQVCSLKKSRRNGKQYDVISIEPTTYEQISKKAQEELGTKAQVVEKLVEQFLHEL
jgi:23S rRNA G2069 N7-methylase RlmK/C1962 C5-methylase RlmI